MKSILNRAFWSLLTIIYSLLPFSLTQVLAIGTAEKVQLQNPLAGIAGSLEDFVLKVIPQILLYGAAPITLVFFLINAMKYLFSAASTPNELTQTKMSMLYTAIGLVVIVGSYAVISFVKTQLGS